MADEALRTRQPGSALDRIARTSAALAGTLPPAVLAAATIATHLPLARDLRFAVGFFAVIPLWVAAMLTVFLLRRGWIAWPLCIAVTAALAATVPDAVIWPSLP